MAHVYRGEGDDERRGGAKRPGAGIVCVLDCATMHIKERKRKNERERTNQRTKARLKPNRC